MRTRRRSTRRSAGPRSGALVLALVGLFGGRAAWADSGDSCISAYEGAQQHRRSGHLLRARAELALCIGSCPSALASDCRTWAAEIAPMIAAVTTEVRAGGAARGDARVWVGGIEQRRGVSVRTEVDPGVHEVRVEAPGMLPASKSVTLAPGTQLPIVFELEPLPEPPSSLPVAGIVLGATGTGALLAGAGLGVAGHLEVADLRETCAPRCAEGDVDGIRTTWIAGGIVAGVGLAALATAVALVLTDEGDRGAAATWPHRARRSFEGRAPRRSLVELRF
jgi:hypothetical protein